MKSPSAVRPQGQRPRRPKKNATSTATDESSSNCTRDENNRYDEQNEMTGYRDDQNQENGGLSRTMTKRPRAVKLVPPLSLTTTTTISSSSRVVPQQQEGQQEPQQVHEHHRSHLLAQEGSRLSQHHEKLHLLDSSLAPGSLGSKENLMSPSSTLKQRQELVATARVDFSKLNHHGWWSSEGSSFGQSSRRTTFERIDDNRDDTHDAAGARLLSVIDAVLDLLSEDDDNDDGDRHENNSNAARRMK